MTVSLGEAMGCGHRCTFMVCKVGLVPCGTREIVMDPYKALEAHAALTELLAHILCEIALRKD